LDEFFGGGGEFGVVGEDFGFDVEFDAGGEGEVEDFFKGGDFFAGLGDLFGNSSGFWCHSRIA
jgi:hypothetical protein